MLSPLLAAVFTSLAALPAWAADGGDDAKTAPAEVAPKPQAAAKAHGKKAKHEGAKKTASTDPAHASKAKTSKGKGHKAKAAEPADKPADGSEPKAATPAKHAKKSEPAAAKSAPAVPSLSGAAPQAAKEPSAAKAPSKAKPSGKRAPAKKKTAKKTADTHARASSGDTKAPPRPCTSKPVTIDRGGLESESLSLVTCTGKPLDAARDRLSVLARPWGAARPAAGARATKGDGGVEELAPGVRRLDPGLVTRVFLIAHEFPGHTISLVGGYRPASRGSMHQSARAVDLRVAGVDEAEVARFCKTIPDTGCGFYPNSSFVHVDVRSPGSGGVSWIDAAGPGEAPRYVTQWPPATDASGAPLEADPPSGVDAETPAPAEPDVEPDGGGAPKADDASKDAPSAADNPKDTTKAADAPKAAARHAHAAGSP